MPENKQSQSPKQDGGASNAAQKPQKAKSQLSSFELVAGTICLVLCTFLLPSIVNEAIKAFGVTPDLYLVNVINMAAGALLSVLVFHKFLFQSFATLKKHPMKVLGTVIVALILNLGAGQMMELIQKWTSLQIANANNDLVVGLLKQHPLVVGLSVCLLAPLTEECLWRGLVFGETKRLNKIFAYLLSISLFALLHVCQSIGTQSWWMIALSFVTYLPSGAILAWAYNHTNTIWCSILAHCAINALACCTYLIV